jgi:hypothetical protein
MEPMGFVFRLSHDQSSMSRILLAPTVIRYYTGRSAQTMTSDDETAPRVGQTEEGHL